MVCALALAASGSASAGSASPWIVDRYSSLRLLSGAPDGNHLTAGIEIGLKPGWKTYWRVPGDSGIPPRFDFTGSDNVETVTVLWPAPTKFADGAGGHSIGYAGTVVLPLRIVPKDVAAPVMLRATVDYAVCERLCVPVQASAELELSTASPPITSPMIASPAMSPALLSALRKVPRPARLGDGELTIEAVRREGEKRVIVDTRVPPGSRADLFVEGPTPDWALPLPAAVETPVSGHWRFAFDLDGLPANAKASGSVLTFTLAGPGLAYEYRATLP